MAVATPPVAITAVVVMPPALVDRLLGCCCGEEDDDAMRLITWLAELLPIECWIELLLFKFKGPPELW